MGISRTVSVSCWLLSGREGDEDFDDELDDDADESIELVDGGWLPSNVNGEKP